ncbi:MAG: tyrosine-type recombinase/integrase [Bacillota bacterium]
MRGKVGKYQGKGGDRYYIVYDLPRDPATGKRRQKKVSGFLTKKEAEMELAKAISRLADGEYIEPTNQTVAEYLTHWLETYGKHNLAESTYVSYRNIIVNHLIPHLGNIPLQKLLPAHLQNYYYSTLKEGRVDSKKILGKALSPTTVLYHHRVIREALHHAFQLGIINRNVADMVKPPRKEKKEIQVLLEEDIPKLLGVVKGTYLYMPVYLALMTGMRMGEILALEWQDIDLNNGVITISKSLRPCKGAEPKFQQPKTPGSRRTVEITPSVIKTLKEHKITQAKKKLATGKSSFRYNLVCCRKDGAPIRPNTLPSQFRYWANKVGIKIRFHDLRHTHATLLLKEGVSPKVVAERLGHSTTRLTLDTYSHVVPGMQRDAALKLEKRLHGIEA